MSGDDEQIPAPATPPGGNTEESTGEVISPARGNANNLRPPWAKGRSGNPRGRPKTKPLTDALRKQLGKRVMADDLEKIQKAVPRLLDVLGKRPTYADLLAWRMLQQSMSGNMHAARVVLDRIEGRVPKDVINDDIGQLDELIAVLMLPPAEPGELND